MKLVGLRVAVVGVWVTCLLASPAIASAQDTGSTSKAKAAERYPLIYIDRPLTLPALMTEASFSGGYWWVDDPENEDAPDFARSGVGARFGVTDWWQVSASTSYWLKPEEEWSELVTVASRVRVIDTDLIDIAPGADALLMFDGDRGTESVPLVSVDAHARIHFCNRVLGRTALYLGDDLVTFGFGDYRRASVDLNAVWVAQSSKYFALRFAWQLFHIRAYGDTQESHGAIPGDMSVLVSPASWLDISLGYQLRSLTRGVVAGVAVRL